VSDYKFVTMEDFTAIGDLRDSHNLPKLEALISLALSECDAIRKVGLAHFKWRFDRDPHLQEQWDGKTTTEEDFDREAARIMEGKK